MLYLNLITQKDMSIQTKLKLALILNSFLDQLILKIMGYFYDIFKSYMPIKYQN